MKKNILIATCIGLLLAACGAGNSHLPIQKVADIVAQMQLAEAYASINPTTLDSAQQYFRGKNIDTLQRYYKIVLQRNNISKDQFSNSFSHYAKDPELMDSMFRMAEKTIEKLAQENMAKNKKAVVVDSTAR
jgi:Domain of unknown function (DUF4296)